MEKAFIYFQMVKDTKETYLMVLKLVLEAIFTQMVTFLKGNGKTTEKMEMESTTIKRLARLIRVILLMVKKMDLGNSSMPLEMFMRVSEKME